MEIDNQNDDDVETIESHSSNEIQFRNDKPLMKLIQRLISDCKQNAILTNSQLIDIMRVELDINVLEIHELEKDIYMTVIKKFLKDWPRWDQFDKIIFNSKKVTSSKDLGEVWEREYRTLRDYLRKMVGLSKPLAADVMREFHSKYPTPEAEEDNSEVDMEVFSTRNQLNQLIYRHPEKNVGQNIFNVSNTPSNKINQTSMSYNKIFNWPRVCVTLKAGGVSYKRRIVDNLQHVLLNKNLPSNKNRAFTKMNTKLQVSFSKNAAPIEQNINRSQLDVIYEKIKEMKSFTGDEDLFVKSVLKLIGFDLVLLPEKWKTPCMFRKNLSEYQYIRHLSSEPADDGNLSNDLYDLEIEERCCPQLEMSVARFDNSQFNYVAHDWLKVECEVCSLTFTGSSSYSDILVHFNQWHCSLEPQWLCMKCQKSFFVAQLADSYWLHSPCQFN